MCLSLSLYIYIYATLLGIAKALASRAVGDVFTRRSHYCLGCVSMRLRTCSMYVHTDVPGAKVPLPWPRHSPEQL